MNRHMGPVRCMGGKPRLHQVEVDALDMLLEVPLVTNQVFPEAALPYAALALRNATRRMVLHCGEPSGECRFDQHPARGKTRVADWQLPDRVQTLRQDHRRFDFEWMRLAHHIPQQVEMVDQGIRTAIGQVERKEKLLCNPLALSLSSHKPDGKHRSDRKRADAYGPSDKCRPLLASGNSFRVGQRFTRSAAGPRCHGP